MSKEKQGKRNEILLSTRFSDDSCGAPEIPFRRWLVGELESGRMSEGEARERFHLNKSTAWNLFRRWRKLYSSDIPLALPSMNEQEKQEFEALHKRVKELEQHLENARMKHIALETLIDVAEEKLRVPIRKKSGPKQ